MLKIFLARHGQDMDNANQVLNGHRDTPLTDLGTEQAKTLAKGIKQYGLLFNQIYCSPLSRAKITAKIISTELGAGDPEILEDLIERDFGTATGKDITTVVKSHGNNVIKSERVTYVLDFEGGENFEQLLVRAQKVLAFVQQHHTDGNILLVTHGDIGKMIYAAYYHLDWKEVLAAFYFGNSDLLELSQNSTADKSHIIRVERTN